MRGKKKNQKIGMHEWRVFVTDDDDKQMERVDEQCNRKMVVAARPTHSR